jgi:DDE superfamily endonuclease
VPRVVVLDNASLHVSRVVTAARTGLAKLGTYLYHLPPYSPELNEIGAVFKRVKHHEIPQRSHTTRTGLREAVEQGFDRVRRAPGQEEPHHRRVRRGASRHDSSCGMTRPSSSTLCGRPSMSW